MDTLRILALESSAKAASCAVSENGKITAYSYQNSGLTHSTTLLPMVEDMLKNLGRRLEDMDLIAVAHGPGSFTGIRIGVATAKALAFVSGVKCLSITSFDTIAYNISGREEKRLLAVINAGHGGYYVCGYDKLKIDFPPKYVMTDELKKLSAEYTLCAGEKLAGFNAEIADLSKGLVAAAFDKASEANFDYDSLNPLYVRKSQAEEGR